MEKNLYGKYLYKDARTEPRIVLEFTLGSQSYLDKDTSQPLCHRLERNKMTAEILKYFKFSLQCVQFCFQIYVDSPGKFQA